MCLVFTLRLGKKLSKTNAVLNAILKAMCANKKERYKIQRYTRYTIP